MVLKPFKGLLCRVWFSLLLFHHVRIPYSSLQRLELQGTILKTESRIFQELDLGLSKESRTM
jgi:hypothetical protein